MPWRGRWRSVLPGVVDEAMVLVGKWGELGPVVVHGLDVYMMHVAARYAVGEAGRGRRVRLVYDAREFVPGLAHVAPRRVEAYSRLEAEFIQDFDRVISVSEPMAAAVTERHGLLERPVVVLNGPVVDGWVDGSGVRVAAGVGPGERLVVYAGVVNPARGLGTVVEALVLLEGVFLAVVVNNRGPAVRALLERAGRLGVGDRVRLVSYVPHGQVVGFLASADVGICPLSHTRNHDLTITNKFCEYVVAGLPVVTSDTPAQAGLVESLGLGGVFRADDVVDCARVLGGVLDRRVVLGGGFGGVVVGLGLLVPKPRRSVPMVGLGDPGDAAGAV
jgi:glycosyltransferase involved in cell wall biosynthesis